MTVVIGKAEKLDLERVTKRAYELEYEIKDEEQTWHKGQAKSMRDQLMTEAQNLWSNASGPENYLAVQQLAQRVLSLDEFRTDPRSPQAARGREP